MGYAPRKGSVSESIYKLLVVGKLTKSEISVKLNVSYTEVSRVSKLCGCAGMTSLKKQIVVDRIKSEVEEDFMKEIDDLITEYSPFI